MDTFLAKIDTLSTFLARHPTSVVGGLALVTYVAIVRHLRYKRIRHFLQKYPDPTLPLRHISIAEEISGSISNLEFPFLNEVALEFALYKTYAIPSISKILAATTQFTNKCTKRADDTVLILMEISHAHSRNQLRVALEGKEDPKEMENDQRRARVAMEKLNFIHGHYPIKQEDYLYTLALFVLEPPAWIGKFDWRPLTELEKNALLAVWIRNGEAMKIENIPRNYVDLAKWTEEYEREHCVLAASNLAIQKATTDLFLSKAPSFLHPFGHQVVSTLLSPRLRAAFATPPPPMGLTSMIHSILWIRAVFIRNFLLPRQHPKVRTALRANAEGRYVPRFNKYAPVYPEGYRVEDLGPEKFLGKCPFSGGLGVSGVSEI